MHLTRTILAAAALVVVAAPASANQRGPGGFCFLTPSARSPVAGIAEASALTSCPDGSTSTLIVELQTKLNGRWATIAVDGAIASAPCIPLARYRSRAILRASTPMGEEADRAVSRPMFCGS
jgi:hypothetical protein